MIFEILSEILKDLPRFRRRFENSIVLIFQSFIQLFEVLKDFRNIGNVCKILQDLDDFWDLSRIVLGNHSIC